MRFLPDWCDKYLHIILAFLLILIPGIVYAGWFDWVGTVAESASKAYIHTIYIQAFKENVVLLGFWLYSILATLQAIGAVIVIKDFTATFTIANRDNRIVGIEKVVIIGQGFVTVIAVTGLMLFSGFLGYTVFDGIQEIKSYGSIEYETIATEEL